VVIENSLEMTKSSNGRLNRAPSRLFTGRTHARMSAEVAAERLRLEGNALFAEGSFLQAAGSFTKALRAASAEGLPSEQVAPLYANRSAALANLGKAKQALADAQEALALERRATRPRLD
jgi:tetratricopeptide (TPR) repeat protein